MTVSSILPVGEVVESSSALFVAQCPKVERGLATSFPQPPELGAFLYVRTLPPDPTGANNITDHDEIDPFEVGNRTIPLEPGLIFGVVSSAQIASIDPSRRPVALGIESEEELRRIQPQVFELVTAEFSVLVTSTTGSTGQLSHRPPSRPPRIHSFVYPCDNETTVLLTEDFGFLRSILSALSGLQFVDELAAAVLRFGWLTRGGDEEYLVRAGKAILSITRGDFDKFQSIIEILRQ